MAALLTAATAAFAARPAPVVAPLGQDPMQSVTFGPQRLTAPCDLGVSTGASTIVNYLLPPDDAYFTFPDPANCSCPGNAVQLNVANLLLNFQAVCAQPVQVRIVPAILVAGCYQPDVATTLCGPLTYSLAPGAVGNFQFNLPLPAGCCISVPAFLDFNFIAPGACNTSGIRPRLITNSTCAPCLSWNVWSGGFDDLCVKFGFPGSPLMWADGDCCVATPTIPGSWGRIKTL